MVEEKLENYISEEKNYVKIQYDYTIPSYFWTHYLRKYGFKNHQISKWIESPSQVGKYIESGTTFFPTLNLAALGSNMEDVQSENFEDQVISQMNLGFYLER